MEKCLEWWFLDNAIVLDTPGHCATQKNNSDAVEWRNFLSLLKKTGKKTPIKGIIVCFSAEVLLCDDTAVLKNEAADVHCCLSDAMLELGISCPVYNSLTVTPLLAWLTILVIGRPF